MCKALERHAFHFLPKLPERLLTDNGPEIVAAEFREMFDSYGIRSVRSTPYKPASNGAVERLHRIIGSFLSALSESRPMWDELLRKVVLIYNNTVHRELGVTPAEFLLNRAHALNIPPVIPNSVKDCWRVGHPRFLPFRVGDVVVRRFPRKGHSTGNKFEPRHVGPFSIIKVNENGVTYEIKSNVDNRVLRIHHVQLHRWMERPSYLVSHKYYRGSAGDAGVVDEQVSDLLNKVAGLDGSDDSFLPMLDDWV